MAIVYRQAEVRSATRLRLTFSNTLASGAFVTSWFTVTSTDFAGADPIVREVLPVSGEPYAAELVLDPRLVDDGLYLLEIDAGVPALDASTAPAASEAFRVPKKRSDPAVTFTEADNMAIVFREDLMWKTGDFVEGPDGDLEILGGPENAAAALMRMAISEPLAHDPDYSPRLRRAVDAPSVLHSVVRHRLARKMQRDPRVVSVEVSSQDDSNGQVSLHAKVEFKGRIRRNVALFRF